MSNSTINDLLSRQSVKFVQAPGPNPQELELILESAMRAPDHGKIRPWRFAIIRGKNIMRILDIGIQAGIENNKPIPEHKIANTRKWLARVPIVIALACAPDPSGRIREEESKLSMACAVMNMQIAAHSMGYSAYWSTGIGTYLDGVGDALGFDALDYHFMGYLSLGTAIDKPQPKERPDFHEFTREWP